MATTREEEPLIVKQPQQVEHSPPKYEEHTKLDLESPPEVPVIVVGLSGTNKSKALNNLFGLHLEAEGSARPACTEVIHECEAVAEDKAIFKVIATPELNTVEVNEKAVLHKLREIGVRKGFLLMLFYSIHPSAAISQEFSNTVKHLTGVFGVDVWNRSMILLAHSDTLRMLEYPEDACRYEEYLAETCAVLEEELKKHGVKKTVKPFTEYKSLDQFQHEEDDTLLAMPVGREGDVKATKLLFPLQPWTHEYSWVKLAYMGMMKIYKDIPQAGIGRHFASEIRYGRHILSSEKTSLKYGGGAGALVGAVSGAIKGASIGSSSGHAGTAIGIVVGAVVGFLAGLFASTVATSAGLLATYHYQARSRRREKQNTSNMWRIMTSCCKNMNSRSSHN